METQYFKEYSQALGRDMEMKIYGQKGRPVLFIPCQDGRFFDFENFHMTETWSPWIDSDQVMVFSIDTIDIETWSDPNRDPGWRSWRYEQWIKYITDEVVPFIYQVAAERNESDEKPGILVFGCSLGATHAANLYFRRPDIFDRVLALSGIYTSEYGFGNYMDGTLYNNSPVHYLSNMPKDHPYIQMYNERKGVICCGQGPWEVPGFTRHLESICRDKGIRIWIDFWGFDCSHDWDWWYKQVAYFVPYLLG